MNRYHTWLKGAGLVVLALILVAGTHPGPSVVEAQGGEVCTALVRTVTQTVTANCSGLGENEACLGAPTAMAMFHDPASTASFAVGGDRVALAEVAVLSTGAADLAASTWGVVLASASGSGGVPVTFALFGDSEIDNVSDPGGEARTCEVTNASGGSLNLRLGPSANRGIVGLFPSGETITADGRNAAGDWVRVDRRGTVGWVFVPLVQVDCDVIGGLREITDDGQVVTVGPLQAITLRSGTPDVQPACAEMPDGLLIAVPEDAQAQVIVNGAILEFGDGAAGFVTALLDGALTVRGLAGEIQVTARDATITVTDGEFTTMPQVGLVVDAAPSAAEFATDFVNVPVLWDVFVNGTGYDAAVEATTGGAESGVGACQVTNASGNSINLRLGPSANRGIAGLFPTGETLLADARSEYSDWVRVERQSIVGWVYVPLVTLSCDVEALPVAE